MLETNFLVNYGEEVAILLFGIGFANLLVQKNLIKKIIGLNIMDTAVYLFLAAMGYVDGRAAPGEGIYYRQSGADRRKRRAGGGGLHQSDPQRACADGNCGIRFGDGTDALAHRATVSAVPYAGSG